MSVSRRFSTTHINRNGNHTLTLNSQSKAQPKSAAAGKATTNGASTRGGRARGRGGRKAGRPKRKTADELDAEMVDYFDANAATNGAAVDESAAMNGTAQPVANDDGMDEISVRFLLQHYLEPANDGNSK